MPPFPRTTSNSASLQAEQCRPQASRAPRRPTPRSHRSTRRCAVAHAAPGCFRLLGEAYASGGGVQTTEATGVPAEAVQERPKRRANVRPKPPLGEGEAAAFAVAAAGRDARGTEYSARGGRGGAGGFGGGGGAGEIVDIAGSRGGGVFASRGTCTRRTRWASAARQSSDSWRRSERSGLGIPRAFNRLLAPGT